MNIYGRRFHVLLLKVECGTEERVIAQAMRLLGGSLIFADICYGDFDCVALAADDGEQKAVPGVLKHVLGVRAVKAYAILPSEVSATQMDRACSQLSESPLLCITFVRTRSSFRDQWTEVGVPDSEFMRWWQGGGEQGQERRLLLGTFGRPNFICLYGHSTISDAYRYMDKIQEAGKCVEKTFSILAVNRRVNQGMPLSMNKHHHIHSLSLRTSVACRPCDVGRLVSECRDSWKRCSAIGDINRVDMAGGEDFSLTAPLLQEDGIDEINAAVLDFRSRCAGDLLNTRTEFLENNGVDDADVGASSSVTNGDESRIPLPLVEVDVTDEQALMLRARLPVRMGERILRALHGVGNTFRNVILIDDVIDLNLHVGLFREHVLKLLENDAPKECADEDCPSDSYNRLNWLSTAMNSLQTALQQRTATPVSGAIPVVPNVSHLIGGSQCLLQAAESIPWAIWRDRHRLWRQSEESWAGYVEIGAVHDYQVTEAGVLRIPRHDIYRPDRWWKLVHETSHGLVDRLIQLNLRDGKTIEEAVEDIVQRSRRENMGGLESDVSFARRLVNEILVDLIQAIHGPYWLSSLMLRGFWDSVPHGKQELLGEEECYHYGTRALVLFAVLKEWDARGLAESVRLRPFPSYLDAHLRMYVDNVFVPSGAGVDEHVPNRAWGAFAGTDNARLLNAIMRVYCRVDEGRLCRICETVSDVIVLVHSMLNPRAVEECNQRRVYWTGSCGEAVLGVLETGHIPDTSMLGYPDLFSWRLWRDSGGAPPFAARAAAIVGLQRAFRRMVASHSGTSPSSSEAEESAGGDQTI